MEGLHAHHQAANFVSGFLYFFFKFLVDIQSRQNGRENKNQAKRLGYIQKESYAPRRIVVQQQCKQIRPQENLLKSILVNT